MRKPKVGDKFIVEITDYNYGMYPSYTINGIKGLHLTKSDFEELDPYHEPTLMEHAKALKEQTKIISAMNNCKGCPFFKECDDFACPRWWELNYKPTDKEKEILEFWKKQGATDIYRCNDEYYYFSNDEAGLGHIEIEGIFKDLKIDEKYKIDDLLEGDER